MDQYRMSMPGPGGHGEGRFPFGEVGALPWIMMTSPSPGGRDHRIQAVGVGVGEAARRPADGAI
jgi:hypothetical protein